MPSCQWHHVAVVTLPDRRRALVVNGEWAVAAGAATPPRDVRAASDPHLTPRPLPQFTLAFSAVPGWVQGVVAAVVAVAQGGTLPACLVPAAPLWPRPATCPPVVHQQPLTSLQQVTCIGTGELMCRLFVCCVECGCGCW